MIGRITTTLGALALGFAANAAVPALAQTNPTGTDQPNAAAPANPGPGATPMNAPAGGQMNAAPSTGMNNEGTNNAATSNEGTNMGNAPANAGAMPTQPPSEQGTNTGAETPSSPAMKQSGGMNHATMHHVSRHSRTVATGDTAEGNAAVARLNDESLHAAQQGRSFSPSGAQQ